MLVPVCLNLPMSVRKFSQHPDCPEGCWQAGPGWTRAGKCRPPRKRGGVQGRQARCEKQGVVPVPWHGGGR